MTSDERPEGCQDGGSLMAQFGTEARFDARMLDANKQITDAQRSAVIRELEAYRSRNPIDGQPMSIDKLRKLIGVAKNTLDQVIKGKYPADPDAVIRKIDAFLAHEEQQGKRTNIRGFQKIKITALIVGAINQAILRRSIAAITGGSGSGKTTHATWFKGQHEGAILITARDGDSDWKFIVDKLHEALKLGTYARHARQKLREIEAFLQSHQNTVIIVDESQKLTNDALETLRSLHDASDPEGQRNVPVVLFGDETFFKTITKSRGGQRTPLSPQITSRMFPVVSLEAHGIERDDDGQAVPGTVYTREDIERIVKNQRLRLVKGDAIGWTVRIANLYGWGRLRLAARVLEIAIDTKLGAMVTIPDLLAALDLFIGPSDAKLVLQQLEHEEARPVAAAG
jgi:hypothetical protein